MASCNNWNDVESFKTKILYESNKNTYWDIVIYLFRNFSYFFTCAMNLYIDLKNHNKKDEIYDDFVKSSIGYTAVLLQNIFFTKNMCRKYICVSWNISVTNQNCVLFEIGSKIIHTNSRSIDETRTCYGASIKYTYFSFYLSKIWINQTKSYLVASHLNFLVLFTQYFWHFIF